MGAAPGNGVDSLMGLILVQIPAKEATARSALPLAGEAEGNQVGGGSLVL